MNWFPRFLNPANAALAAAIVAPLLLLLYFLKLRRREAAVSSTLLWKKAIQDLQVNAPFQRLRRNLLLFLQMALLLLLALAFARPVVNYTPGAGKLTVILLDRSASMSTRDDGKHSRLDVAKSKAKEIVSSMDSSSSAAVIAFDDSAETVQGFTTDGALLRRAIDSVEPTDRRSRLKLAYQLAEAQSTFNPNQNRAIVRPDVFLYSDGRVLDSDDLRINGNVTYVPIGSDQTGNIGIVSLSAKRNYEQPTQVQVFARLANYGPKPIDAQVQLSVAATDPDRPNELHFIAKPGGFATVNLPPARWSDPKWVEAHPKEKDDSYVTRESVEFNNVELTTAAVVKVEQMNKDGDSLAADDAAQVVVPPPKQLAVLHVSDGQNPYLDLALSSLNLQNVKKMSPETYAAEVPIDYDVIVFDRYSPKKLPPAGAFIYFGAYPPDDVKLQPVKEDGVVAMTQDVRVVDWKRDHPILRGLSLGRIGATEAIRLKPTLDSTVLVDGVNGPLIVLQREGRGTHLVVAFDVLQSNWPLMQSFPVFMHHVIQFMAIGSEMDVRESLAPGSTPRIPRANLQRLGDTTKQLTLAGPEGSQTVMIPPAGDFALPALNRVGVYTLSPAVPQFERIAVNLLNDNESNVLPVTTSPGNIGQVIVNGQSQSRLELWWWIIAAVALPLLLIEWWVYTKRVHL
ncbi:BatA and WFA domain-containing protein [soil metagenome]